jgi:antitoxin YefM
MVTVYRMNVNELNEQFITSLQALFKDTEVEITVTAIDETAYLLQSEPNRKRLMEAIANIENGIDLIDASADILQ